MTKRWQQRPPGSTWGDWGDDDELGRINLLTPEKVLQGVREVQTGETFCLSLPLDYPGGTALNQRRYPPVIRPTEDLDGNPDTFYNVHQREIVQPSNPGVCNFRKMRGPPSTSGSISKSSSHTARSRRCLGRRVRKRSTGSRRWPSAETVKSRWFMPGPSRAETCFA